MSHRYGEENISLIITVQYSVNNVVIKGLEGKDQEIELGVFNFIGAGGVAFDNDSLPTFPDEQAFECIERELGFPLDSIYSSISPSPIAAVSLGQVYKARLKYPGKLLSDVVALMDEFARRVYQELNYVQVPLPVNRVATFGMRFL
ncbi:hypothetical protein GUJ93_ZPchr0004g40301 [Zizania palustris]|uniref:ABC1 atypical kinase-like domain-containing protein n=1 Tax=Zizania palustris TaxID=103762 RepID=A0A8J5VFT0_ZIZPA|nr:hypothetical protein GUJ93_ZPchr0004g40301 [Zizania palustris]